MSWVRSPKGKAMPMDTTPVPFGRWRLAPREDDPTEMRAVFIKATETWQGPRYTSHFETCPNAKQHSKRTRGEDRKPADPAALEQMGATRRNMKCPACGSLFVDVMPSARCSACFDTTGTVVDLVPA